MRVRGASCSQIVLTMFVLGLLDATSNCRVCQAGSETHGATMVTMECHLLPNGQAPNTVQNLEVRGPLLFFLRSRRLIFHAAGDIIGCGVDFSQNRGFYTKNGTFLGSYLILTPNENFF